MNVSDKLQARTQQCNSLLCVGLDSELEKISGKFRSSATPQFDFNKMIIDTTHEYVSCYKPNMAFYEARGEQGIRELKMTMDYIQEKHSDIFTICDAKRADIGNTNQGYVESIFDWFGFDAITLHPYLGKEALQPFLDRKDKTSIILCRTSNPGAPEFQDLISEGKPLWQIVANHVATTWNVNNNCMLVIGATYPDEMRVIRSLFPMITFLVPGIGAQGGDVKATVQAGKNEEGTGLIISASRSIIFDQDPGKAAQILRDEINMYR
jgi:orotidine-5'-phosphate decarboxylase